MVYSAKHREYQIVAKSTVPCFFVFFLNCYFHNVDFFHCAPELGGGTTQIWGHAKKISGAKGRWSLCPQLQNRVGAYVGDPSPKCSHEPLVVTDKDGRPRVSRAPFQGGGAPASPKFLGPALTCEHTV